MYRHALFPNETWVADRIVNILHADGPEERSSESLVTIALALQDMGEPHRASGTALFERMLEFNLPYAREILTDLDKRTANRSSTVRQQRRRHRRKARR